MNIPTPQTSFTLPPQRPRPFPSRKSKSSDREAVTSRFAISLSDPGWQNPAPEGGGGGGFHPFGRLASAFRKLRRMPRGRGQYALLAAIAVAVLAALYLAGAALSPAIPPKQGGVAEANCTDSDGGSLPAAAGTCRGGGEFRDTCLSELVLLEYRCAGSSCASVTVNCSTLGMGCAQGACTALNSTGKANATAANATSGVQLPDLGVASITRYVTNTSTPNGTRNLTLYLDVAVVNTGKRPAHTTRTIINLNGPVSGRIILDTPVIEAGRMIILSTTFALANITGSYTVNATADILDGVKEIKEGNNYNEITFQVT